MSRIHQMTVAQWEAAFPDEDACKAHLTAHRWPEGVACARCGNEEAQELGFKTWHRHCVKRGEPKYRFAVIASTVFENTNVPLRHWFRVIHLLLAGKEGKAAIEIQRMLGFRSCRAWYMFQRIRAALADESFRKLMGIAEVDESINGDNAKNRRGHILPPARSPSREVLRLRYR
jgi:hypothetical protein